jgi:hypothetical protein
MSRCQYDSLTFNRPVISDRHDMMVIGAGRERVGGKQHEIAAFSHSYQKSH